MTMTSSASPMKRASTNGMIGRPLQICEIDFEENVVNCNHENLRLVEENLAKMGEYVGEPNLKVGVISVMGMYRTGKSFLLDLLMRYLRQDGPITKFDPNVVWAMGMDSYSTDAFTWLTSGQDAGEVRITEGQNVANERGFAWRPGIEKTTKGVWLWSKPFLLDHDGRDPLAILVMDTQGAWDSQMSSEHSACIFGITSLLSSKLIYNLQNRISEEKIDNLDYFTTFASIVIQEAREKHAQQYGADIEEEPGLGDLHFLVRDWEYFDDEWTLEKCTKQVSQHLMTHLDPNNVTIEERRETIQRLHNLFRSVNLCCLPHPGPKIPKANWKGTASDINTDFLYLLTHFFANLSHGEYPLKVSAPLGQELTVKSFCRVVEELVEAFKTARPDATSLRKAFVNCETFRAKDEAVANFNKEVDSLDGLMEPDQLSEFIESARQKHIALLNSRIRPLASGSDDTAWRDELVSEVDATIRSKMEWITQKNDLLYNQATLKLIATPILTLPLAATVLGFPHILLGMMAAGGGVAHVNARAGEQGVQGWFLPETLEKVKNDLEVFFQARMNDVKQMMFVGRHCDKLPGQVMTTINTSAELGSKLLPVAGVVAEQVGQAVTKAVAAGASSSNGAGPGKH